MEDTSLIEFFGFTVIDDEGRRYCHSCGSPYIALTSHIVSCEWIGQVYILVKYAFQRCGSVSPVHLSDK